MLFDYQSNMLTALRIVLADIWASMVVVRMPEPVVDVFSSDSPWYPLTRTEAGQKFCTFVKHSIF